MDVGCILDSVPAADRPQLTRDTLANAETPLTNGLTATAEACAMERGWNPDQADTFAGWAAAIILRDDAAGRLRAAPLPVAAIDEWFAAQSEATRTSPALDQVVMEDLITMLMARGTADAVLQAESETIGVYIGARIMIERGIPIRSDPD